MLPSRGTAIFRPPARGAPSGVEWQATQLPRRATYSPCERPAAAACAALSVAKVLSVVTGSEPQPASASANRAGLSLCKVMVLPFFLEMIGLSGSRARPGPHLPLRPPGSWNPRVRDGPAERRSVANNKGIAYGNLVSREEAWQR